MKQDTKYKVKGVSFTGLLTIAFIVLKLCKVISWSWVWVLAPLWIPFIITLVILGICALVARRY